MAKEKDMVAYRRYRNRLARAQNIRMVRLVWIGLAGSPALECDVDFE